MVEETLAVPGAVRGRPTDAAGAAKRAQILEGARQIFRAQGFDGASMGEIARVAGVSKGTLYVYFDSKESLFEALVIEDRRQAAELLFRLDSDDPDVRGVLRRLGCDFVRMMTRPDHIAMVRMVMGAAEKFPRIGRVFYEAGPRTGLTYLAAYLAVQVKAGRLVMDDVERAAVQFMHLCQGELVKGLFFACGEQPTPEAIEATVESALNVFFAAYGPKR